MRSNGRLMDVGIGSDWAAVGVLKNKPSKSVLVVAVACAGVLVLDGL